MNNIKRYKFSKLSKTSLKRKYILGEKLQRRSHEIEYVLQILIKTGNLNQATEDSLLETWRTLQSEEAKFPVRGITMREKRKRMYEDQEIFDWYEQYWIEYYNTKMPWCLEKLYK